MKISTMIKHTGIALGLTVMIFQHCNGQVISAIQKSFEETAKSTMQEKIYVHTDKTAYLAGELLWFKVYCVNADDNKLLGVSKVAYMEVLDNKQTPVFQAKVALTNGTGSGSVYVPVSISNGNFKLRAYTAWMKNFGPDYFFEKDLTIINPLRSPEAVSKLNKTAFDIQFFPEGGNMVNGISCKVAFKATGADGKGMTIRGALVNQRNDTVARFKTLKFGMGSFYFVPATGNTYRAVVYAQGSKPVVRDLPAAYDHGYTMHLGDQDKDQLTITVKMSGVSNKVYLFGQTRRQVKIAEAGTATNDSVRFNIDVNKLGDGISTFTVFNEAKQPVCERLYFKLPKRKMTIEGNSDQSAYTTRKKVEVRISAKDQSGNPLPADMSVAIYRVDSLQKADENDIYSYLWLSSDLRGSIQSPGYYFNNTGSEADQAMDNLLLTQGWRRFQWDDMLNGKANALNFLPEYTGHIINAKIFNTTTNLPAKDIVAYLGIPGKRVQLTTSKSDSTGHLLFNMKDFYGPGEIVLQTNYEKDSTYRMEVQSPFAEQFSKTSYPAFNLTPGLQKDIETLSLGMQVQNIYAGSKTRQFINPVTDSSAFYGTPFKSYKLDDFTRFTTMEEVLREYISEVNVVRTRGRFHIKVLSENGFLDSDPLVMVDGVPVFNIDKVFAIDPLKVRKLEVMPNRYFFQAIDAEGILSYTTYKGDLGGYEIDPRAVVVDYEGMQLQRQFYSPVYDTEQQTSSPIPDFRNLLYWSADANTDKDGKRQLTFYTSDQTGQYIGIVQGISKNGVAGSKVFTFEVKQNYTAELKK
jgi:hypothetical protein